MFAASVMPRSTTLPITPPAMHTLESEPLSAQPLPLKSAQPAPVTVRWLVGTACEPISSGNLYCRSAVEKWLLAAQATLSAKPPSISMEPISIPSAIVEHAP